MIRWKAIGGAAFHCIDSELMSGGWTQLDLKARGKGVEFKVQLALKLRAETTVTVAWIAERLHMGTRGSLAQLLRAAGQTKGKPSHIAEREGQSLLKLID